MRKIGKRDGGRRARGAAAAVLAMTGTILGAAVGSAQERPRSSEEEKPAARQEASVGEGARVYGSMCGRCHNPRSPLERTDRDWAVIVNHMRVRGNLTGDQVRDVLAFLQATNGSPARAEPSPVGPARGGPEPGAAAAPAPGGPELVERGRQIVQARACLGCHVIEGQGGQVGPSLDGVVRRRGEEFVRKKLADPTFNNPTSMMPNFGLSPEEIDAILAYLASLVKP